MCVESRNPKSTMSLVFSCSKTDAKHVEDVLRFLMLQEEMNKRIGKPVSGEERILIREARATGTWRELSPVFGGT